MDHNCVFSHVQWMDFTESAQFSDSSTKLLDAIHTLIGDGSGPERCIQFNTIYCLPRVPLNILFQWGTWTESDSGGMYHSTVPSTTKLMFPVLQCGEEGTTGGTHVEPWTPSAISVQELVAKEVEKLRVELMDTVHSLEAKVTELSTRIAMLESRER